MTVTKETMRALVGKSDKELFEEAFENVLTAPINKGSKKLLEGLKKERKKTKKKKEDAKEFRNGGQVDISNYKGQF
jgi:ribosomal protein L12E/L44/L45/RPP1/RPP2